MASNVVFGAYSPGRLYLKSDRSFSLTPVTHPVLGTLSPHRGDDWPTVGKTGVDIRAASDGVVVYRGAVNGYGNVSIIEHTRADGSKFRTLYAHMANESSYGVDSKISAGQVIRVQGTGVEFFELNKRGVCRADRASI